jgi:hypothetical protein
MKRMIFAALVASAAAGCASPNEIRQAGYAHLQKAQYYEAEGDYYHASRERAAANKQFAKANQRAYDEASVGVYRY